MPKEKGRLQRTSVTRALGSLGVICWTESKVLRFQGSEEEITAWKEQAQHWGHPGGAVWDPTHRKGWSQLLWFFKARSKVQNPLVWSCSSSLALLMWVRNLLALEQVLQRSFRSRSCKQDLGHHLSEQVEGSMWFLATQLHSPVLDKTICSQKTPNNGAEARCLFLIAVVHATSF